MHKSIMSQLTCAYSQFWWKIKLLIILFLMEDVNIMHALKIYFSRVHVNCFEVFA